MSIAYFNIKCLIFEWLLWSMFNQSQIKTATTLSTLDQHEHLIGLRNQTLCPSTQLDFAWHSLKMDQNTHLISIIKWILGIVLDNSRTTH